MKRILVINDDVTILTTVSQCFSEVVVSTELYFDPQVTLLLFDFGEFEEADKSIFQQYYLNRTEIVFCGGMGGYDRILCRAKERVPKMKFLHNVEDVNILNLNKRIQLHLLEEE